MRILYISHLTEQNGATTALVNIIKGMTDKGVVVGLVVPSKNGYLYREAEKAGAIIFDGLGYPFAMLKPDNLSVWNYLKWFVNESRVILGAHKILLNIINNFHPDIVHCNTSVIDYGLLGCWLKHIPFVWHVREYIDMDFGYRIFPSMRMLRWKMHCSNCHCVAITKGVFGYFKLSVKKDVVLYDGVIKEKVSIISSNIPTYSYFLYVGTFIEAKGAHTIFEIFDVFHRQHPNIHLCLACRYDVDSDYYKRCMRSAEAGHFKDYIHFLGFQTDVLSLMSGALALIVPSKFEGFGFITAEAMSVGTIVIGRNTAGTKEQFDNGLKQTGDEIGLRFEKDEELPLLMNRIMTEDFSKMKLRARDVVLQNYSIEKQNEKLYRFYEGLCKKQKVIR